MRTDTLFLLKFSIVAATIASLVAVIPAQAQSSSPDEPTIQLTPADHSAAIGAKVGVHHAYPANNAAGQALRARQIAERRRMNNASGDGNFGGTILQYTGDVTSLGGNVLTSAVSHAIYLQRQTGSQCTIATCWGDPEEFLRDLDNSDFIHVIDQYVWLHDANRYTVGFHATVNYTPQATPLLDTDIQAIVHAVAAKKGASGYGHIYHVFLPPGQDECFDSTLSECYSPDNPATFYICGYHSSVDFADIGHVIYTFQPYQNVNGCQVQPGTPNGRLVDSADDNLDHELIESITDPDGDAWTNTSSAYYSGAEIADECQYYKDFQNEYLDSSYVPTFQIGAHVYAVQLVYSNEQHACSSAP